MVSHRVLKVGMDSCFRRNDEESSRPRVPLRDPIGYENVEFSFGGRITVGGPYELFAIRREHGEAIKISIECNLFRVFAIVSTDVEME